MLRILITLGLTLALAFPALAQGEADLDAQEILLSLPVQSGGRMKPLDTLARESVQLITGKVKFEGRHPVEQILHWWADPEAARAAKVIEFRDYEIKEKYDLDPDQRWYSFDELFENPKLTAAREEIHHHLEQKEELHDDEETLQELFVKMNVLYRLSDGTLFTAVPHPGGLQEAWGSFSDLEHGNTVEVVAGAKSAVATLKESLKAGDRPQAREAAVQARQQLHQLGPVPEDQAMLREIRYNETHPFRIAWVLYLVGLLPLAFAKPAERGLGYWMGFSIITTGFILHAYGFYLRCLIAGRPPVTNMYESVIWVAFGAVLFALIFEAIWPKKYYLVAAATGAVACLILADLLPTVLDPSIQPLTPVLRSNFWLTVHVLTICLGYAGFLLALGLGHFVLWKCAMRPEQKAEIASLHDGVYRAIQIGVLLLAAGTILGGVWANDSWGRFWGWDPKEVWALIALLGYLAILHGRYAGWLRQFGMAAWSIIAFQGVVMAWYGVNYVLGAGLHSYGFGSGGVEYVACYVVLEILYVLWATWRYRANQAPPAVRS